MVMPIVPWRHPWPAVEQLWRQMRDEEARVVELAVPVAARCCGAHRRGRGSWRAAGFKGREAPHLFRCALESPQ
jgi:hypothetical protein